MDNKLLLRSVYASTADYYTRKAKEFGATPFGVDWSCAATQEMRFVQLLRLCDFDVGFTVNDLGCGYGALLAFLDREHAGCEVDYLGIDVSMAMVRLARQQFPKRRGARFVTGHTIPRVADYSVASGIFNVRLDQPVRTWEAFIAATLQHMAKCSLRGFAVNFVWAPSPGLYATTSSRWADYCARQLAAEPELVENYGLREFTLLARLCPHGRT